MKTLFLLSILFFALPCYSFDDWTYSDYTLQTLYFSLLYIDCQQTKNRPDDSVETNIIIGENPSEKKVNLFFGSLALFNFSISYVLPRPFRNIWHVVFISFSAKAIHNNYIIGAKFNF